MRLITPDSLRYPITVTRLRHSSGDHVERFAPLFDYQYKSKVIEGSRENPEGEEVERTWPSTFESETEGKLMRWDVTVGQVITKRGTFVAEIEEPCKHELQFGGLCVLCTKDMTTVSYNTTVRDTARATVNTVHGHTSLLVSQAEANKSDEEAKRRLLASRKLSLVVDLDQTIIHATVDPTVAEWQKDQSNPNYPAVKDVRAFQLVDEGPGARACWYYIKLRPGLKEFLEAVSKIYELHIYTMGTRAYAQNIAQIIDPERKIFADRILSRDESGSMTAKNLKRLFPVDTKMVVIIDDRGDVWQWSPNLIKVSAYDFFVGIGDINSSFLPKRPELEAKAPKPAKVVNGVSASDHGKSNAMTREVTVSEGNSQLATTSPAAEQAATEQANKSPLDQLVSMSGGDDLTKLKEQTNEQDETIEAQLNDRPLLQKQRVLDAAEEASNCAATVDAASDEDGAKKDESLPEMQQKYRHNLLQDDDTELKHLETSLRTVHRAFYDGYDRELQGSQGGRLAELRPGKHAKKRSIDDLQIVPDVSAIMASMKQQVLAGTSLVFSGVVPLGVNIQNHDLGIWAKSFGATITENITKRTTHVVASPQRRTAKVRQAAKRPDKIKIVTQQWLYECFSRWKHEDERPYRVHDEAAAENGPVNAANENASPFDAPDESAPLSSSDEEAALTEEESETPNGLPPRLEIQTELD
ncbi:CTD phosphatase Fcp1, partial [Elasticomyces elasticus]